MKEIVIYAAQAGALATCSYLVYKAIFARDALHRLRRWVLLGLMVASFALPVCHITIYRSPVMVGMGVDRMPDMEMALDRLVTEGPDSDADNPVASAEAGQALSTATLRNLVPDIVTVTGIVWLAGIVVILARRFAGVVRVRRVMRRATSRFRTDEGIEVLLVDDDIAPFSFGGRIVLSRSDWRSMGAEMIVRHETVHVRERHGFDLAAVNIAAALLWFNPFVWLLRHELVLVHEVAADSGVIESGIDAKTYQYLLISKIACASGLSPVANYFRTNDLRKRIRTMKRKTSRVAALKALLLIPLTGVALVAFAQTPLLTGRPVAEKVKIDKAEVVSVDINAIRNNVTIPLSELAEKLEIVYLETRREALFSNGKVFLSDNYIGIATGNPRSFKLFDRKGKYLRDIGHEGRGPGEYGNIYSAAIDEKSQTIYILPWQATELLAFGIDGTHKEPIKLAYNAPKGVFNVNADGTFSFAIVPAFGASPSWVWTQDRTGRVLNEVPAPVGRRMDFSSEIAAGKNTGGFDPFLMMYGNTDNDALADFDPKTGRATPVFTVRNIQSKKPPFYSYTELPRHFIGNYTPGMEQVSETSSQGLPPVHFIVDKKTLRGATYNLEVDELGGLAAGYNFSQGYYIGNWAAIYLKQNLEGILASGNVKDDAVRRRITELNNSIEEEDNNVILLARLKK